MNKFVIFLGGVVVGGAIGAVATYIFYGRKAEEKALSFYEEQVAIFKKTEEGGLSGTISICISIICIR